VLGTGIALGVGTSLEQREHEDLVVLETVGGPRMDRARARHGAQRVAGVHWLRHIEASQPAVRLAADGSDEAAVRDDQRREHLEAVVSAGRHPGRWAQREEGERERHVGHGHRHLRAI